MSDELTEEQRIALIAAGKLTPEKRPRKSIPTFEQKYADAVKQQAAEIEAAKVKHSKRAPTKRVAVYNKQGKRLKGKQLKAYIKRQEILAQKQAAKDALKQQKTAVQQPNTQIDDTPVVPKWHKDVEIIQNTLSIDNILSHLRTELHDLTEFPEFEPDTEINNVGYRLQCHLSALTDTEQTNVENFNLLNNIDITEYATDLNDDKLCERLADKPPKYEQITECRLRLPRNMYYKFSQTRQQRIKETDNDITEKCNCIADTSMPESPNKNTVDSNKHKHNDKLKSINCNSGLCPNAAMYIECTDDTCSVPAPLCQNRVISQKSWKQVRPFKTELKGWGLQALEPIKAGEFIIEYLGEVINNAMCIDRITTMNDKIDIQTERLNDRREKLIDKEIDRLRALGHKRIKRDSINVFVGKPAVAAYYFLTLDDDVIIDANKCGSDARYINHSCAPNCVVQKWQVDTHLCAAFYAVKDIEPYEELTIDYKYDRIGDLERQVCFCGETTCAKYIGGEKSYITDAVQQKRRKKKTVKKLTKLHIDDYDHDCAVCGQGGDVILCEGKICGEFCSKVYHIECVNMTDVPNYTWLCPRHCCDGCGKRQPTIYCSGPVCRDSWCSICIDAAKHDTELQLIDDTDENQRMIELGRNERFVICCDCQADKLEAEQAAAEQKHAEELLRQQIQTERQLQYEQQQLLIAERYKQLINNVISNDEHINDSNYRKIRFDNCVAELGSIPLLHSKAKRGTRKSVHELKTVASRLCGIFRQYDNLQREDPEFFIARLHAIKNKFYHKIDGLLDFEFPSVIKLSHLALKLKVNVDALRNAYLATLNPTFEIPTQIKQQYDYEIIQKRDWKDDGAVKMDNIVTGRRKRTVLGDNTNIHDNATSPQHKRQKV